MGDGLQDGERRSIVDVLSRFPEVERVTLFGSRAMGTARRNSDIDLAIEGANVDLEVLARVSGALDRLPLPYRFDVVDRKSISNPDFLVHIRHHGTRFYERTP